jgi:cell wall-associated NlpC family hydrolase
VGLRPGIIASAVVLAALVAPAAASAATAPTDVGTGFWARSQVVWTVNAGWMGTLPDGRFRPGRQATRANAARVLSRANQLVNAVPAEADAFAQAVTAGWMTAGDGPEGAITQLEFDRAIVRVLGIRATTRKLNTLRGADGWRPALPQGFGAEQAVRQAGARYNAPHGADEWETWPASPLKRTHLAVQAYELGHLSSWWRWSVTNQEDVVTALPAYTPLKQKVLGFAIRYAGAPYVWGGTSPSPQTLFGRAVQGGFDCSGFVWWVLKSQTYTLDDGFSWSGNSQIAWRTTYDMSAHVPFTKRIARADLRPGDILFWSSNPNGRLTDSNTIYHTGIYLGNGWTINSHGSGAGVTLDYMGDGAGWFHDAFAFGWRVLPNGR